MINISHSKRSVWSAAFSISLVTLFSSQAQDIQIERKVMGEKCIMGYLSVAQKPICYTLELPAIANIPNMSAIPEGTYKAFVRTDGDKGWRIEIKDVPGRTNVQIHLGNYTSDSTGCTLVGLTASVDNCTVLDSKKAMDALRITIAAFADKEIRVQYKNPI